MRAYEANVQPNFQVKDGRLLRPIAGQERESGARHAPEICRRCNVHGDGGLHALAVERHADPARQGIEVGPETIPGTSAPGPTLPIEAAARDGPELFEEGHGIRNDSRCGKVPSGGKRHGATRRRPDLVSADGHGG